MTLNNAVKKIVQLEFVMLHEFYARQIEQLVLTEPKLSPSHRSIQRRSDSFTMTPRLRWTGFADSMPAKCNVSSRSPRSDLNT